MMRKKCDECGGRLVKKKVVFNMLGISLGKFFAEVCVKCGEEVFDEKTSNEIDKVAKERGLFGIARKMVATS